MNTPNVVQEEALRQWMRSAIGRCALRGLMVWLFYRGYKTNEIASIFLCCERTVTRWVSRYEAEGIDGLVDRPRPGAPRQADDAVARHLDQLLTPQPEGQSRRWTVGSLCQEVKEHLRCSLSASSVRRLLHSLRYRWRRPRLATIKEDP